MNTVVIKKEHTSLSEMQDTIRMQLYKRDESVLSLMEKFHLRTEREPNRDLTGESHINFAIYYSLIVRDYDKFTLHAEAARGYFDLQDNRRAAYYYGNIAFCYQVYSEMPQSQSFFLRAIYCMEQITDRTVDETKKLASHYYNLYILFGFSDLGTLDKRYIDRALELNISVDNKLGIGFNYSAIVADYDRQGKTHEALEYALKRIQIVEELQDPHQLGFAYCNAGLMYAKLSERDLAFRYFDKAHKILFPESSYQLQAGYHQEIAEAYSVFENHKKAIANYLEAIRLYQHIGSTLNLSKIYRLLSKAYKSIGDFANALTYQEKYSQSLLDSFKLDKLLAVTATEHEYEQKQQQLETAILKQKNEEISVYVRQLEQSNDDLKQFAHAASHDLREPVRAIVSYASLLERSLGDRLSKEEREYIVYLKDGGRRIYEMVTGILAVSKVNSNQDVAEVDLNDVFTQAVENIKLSITAKHGVIDCPPLPSVMGSSTLLIQLFQNLMSNSIKYNESPAPHVRISYERYGAMYQFCISDNGIGIDDKHKNDVFDIFTRLHNRDQYQGTGIGLSICKKIVERMGGRIRNQPNATGGTDFIFTLPAET